MIRAILLVAALTAWRANQAESVALEPKGEDG